MAHIREVATFSKDTVAQTPALLETVSAALADFFPTAHLSLMKLFMSLCGIRKPWMRQSVPC